VDIPELLRPDPQPTGDSARKVDPSRYRSLRWASLVASSKEVVAAAQQDEVAPSPTPPELDLLAIVYPPRIGPGPSSLRAVIYSPASDTVYSASIGDQIESLEVMGVTDSTVRLVSSSGDVIRLELASPLLSSVDWGH